LEPLGKGKQGRWVFRNQRWYFLPGERDVFEYAPGNLDKEALTLLADPADLVSLLRAASALVPLPFMVGISRPLPAGADGTELPRLDFSSPFIPPWIAEIHRLLPAAGTALEAALESACAAAIDGRRPTVDRFLSTGAGVVAEPFGIHVDGSLTCHGAVAMLDIDEERVPGATELARELDLDPDTATRMLGLATGKLPSKTQTEGLLHLFRLSVRNYNDRLTEAFSSRLELAAEQARSRHFLVRAESLERRLLRGHEEVDQARQRSGAVAAELSAILENPGIGITIEDTSHIIRYVNPMMRRSFGNVIGRKCYEAFKGRAEPCSMCPIRQIWEEGMDSVRYTSTDPRTGRSFEVLSVPLVSETGDKLVVEVGLDITHLMKEQKQAEARILRMSERNRLYREMLSDFNEILVQLAGVLSYLMVDLPGPEDEEDSVGPPVSPAAETERKARVGAVLAQLGTVLDTVSWLAVASSAERTGTTVDAGGIFMDALAEAIGRPTLPFPVEIAVMPPVECDGGLLRAALAATIRSLTGGDPDRLSSLTVGHTMSGRRDAFATGDGWHVLSVSMAMGDDPVLLPGALFDSAHVHFVAASLLARRLGGAIWRAIADGRDCCHISVPVVPSIE
jgi:PAS domain-containing protein